MTSEIIRGTITSKDSSHVFEGGETLDVSVVDASRMDAPSITLGETKITLKQGQTFPIEFEFSYDKSRVGQGYGGASMQSRIIDKKYKLIYVNDTRTPLVENVAINVVKS
ncbi:hypothetical protein I4U23_019957 [Adineta vaga]|nr:hypothetical protein I4U23_019957 [Adineta vaga]